MFISRFVFSVLFYLYCSFSLLSNILRPRRKCWEDWYKLNEWADERFGRRAYDGGADDAVGAVSEFFNPSSWIVTPRVAFFNDPNQITNLEMLLGRRLSFRSTDQRRYIFLKPTCPNCSGVGMCTGVPLTMIELVDATDSRNSGCLVTE